MCIIEISVDPYETIEDTNERTVDYDFDDFDDMSVIFDIDEAEKTVAVPLVDTDIPENPERFVVYITGYDGVDILPPTGHVFGTIYDDDKNTSKSKKNTSDWS